MSAPERPGLAAARLIVDGLRVHLGGRDILRGADLHVPRGAVVGLLGPNGCGKSTLLRTVYRALVPDDGALIVDDEDLLSLDRRVAARTVAALAQSGGSDLNFTVEELVSLGRTPHRERGRRLRREELDLRDCALSVMGLDALRHRGVLGLSGGETQRALIARALVQEPRLLVLDEPTNHLDLRHQLEVLSLLRGLECSTLVVLHDLNLAAAVCDLVYLLADGVVVADGSPREVLTPEVIRQVFGVDVVVIDHPLTGDPQILHTLPTPQSFPDHLEETL